jgi:hypothetical protein
MSAGVSFGTNRAVHTTWRRLIVAQAMSVQAPGAWRQRRRQAARVRASVAVTN